jgi:hypothetical protein
MCMKINELSSIRRSSTPMVPRNAAWVPFRWPRQSFGERGLDGTSVWRGCRRGFRNNSTSRRRAKRPPGGAVPPKDVKNEGRSGNVYENKGPYDNFPDTKDDISARLNAILQKITRILQEPSAYLRLFECWRANRMLQNVGTREARHLTGVPSQITR